MLPPGHVAAGYLTAYTLLKITKPDLDPVQMNALLAWGAFFGFAPDLDVFYFFLKNKTVLVANQDAFDHSHRKFFSHGPVYWLVAGLLLYFFSSSQYVAYVGLLWWLGSWSHFVLDTVEYGIPWLHPFSTRLFALKNREYKVVVPERGFVAHTIHFLKLYATRLSFYLEIIIIALALTIYFL